MSSFACKHCGAQYTLDQVTPGSTFTCGACDQQMTAPAAPPTARSSPARRGPSRHARPSDHAKSGGNKVLVLIGVGVAIAVVIGMVAAFSGSDDEQSPADKKRAEQEQRRDADLKAADDFKVAVEKRHDTATGDGAWDAAHELYQQADAWQTEKRERQAIEVLRGEASRLKSTVLNLDPDHAKAREEKGQRKYADELVPYIEADYLEDTDRIRARDAHKRIHGHASKDNGWCKKELFETSDALLTTLEPKRKAWEKLTGSDFYKTATRMEQEIQADLEKRFADLEDGKWPGAIMRVRHPFVFFIQQDASWDPQHVANSRSRALAGLQDIILSEFGEDLGLAPVEVPVPILMFRTHGMYQKYAGSGPGVLAHFEPLTGRLAVHDDCDHTTIMHEGTHQLMWFWTNRKKSTNRNPAQRSYWFQEGIAEWYSGAHRSRTEAGTWTYDIGLLHEGRLSNISQLMSRSDSKLLFNIKELVQCRYRHRALITRTHRTGALYAQGWFLIYFMNHFKVDAEGYVKIGEKGKYADRWREYVKSELRGQTGLSVFMEKMKLDETSFKQLSDEYWRYARWVNKKMSLKATISKRVIPWDKQKNRRGEVSGEKKDDLLPEVAPADIPPWDRDTIGGKPKKGN